MKEEVGKMCKATNILNRADRLIRGPTNPNIEEEFGKAIRGCYPEGEAVEILSLIESYVISSIEAAKSVANGNEKEAEIRREIANEIRGYIVKKTGKE